jgi:hypothetical protein
MGNKICQKCNAFKDLTTSFYKRSRAKDGYENTCIECRRLANSVAHQKRYSPDKRRNQHLQKSYQIDQVAYQLMLIKQDFKCAICKQENNGRVTDKHFVVDHCHDTGAVRGLLCHSCNTALGGFKDNPKSLRTAASYLERFYDG